MIHARIQFRKTVNVRGKAIRGPRFTLRRVHIAALLASRPKSSDCCSSGSHASVVRGGSSRPTLGWRALLLFCWIIRRRSPLLSPAPFRAGADACIVKHRRRLCATKGFQIVLAIADPGSCHDHQGSMHFLSTLFHPHLCRFRFQQVLYQIIGGGSYFLVSTDRRDAQPTVALSQKEIPPNQRDFPLSVSRLSVRPALL